MSIRQAGNQVVDHLDRSARNKNQAGRKRKPTLIDRLEKRIGPVHLGQRLGIQADHASRTHGIGLNFLHLENVRWLHQLLALSLRLVGLYNHGQQNALDLRIRKNHLYFSRLPIAFDHFRILHLSDLHLDIHEELSHVLIDRLSRVEEYDLCVITGDFRSSTIGPAGKAMSALAQVRPHITGPIYAVLGNHDFIEMTIGLEDMGIRVLLNESAEIVRGEESIHLAGVDDPHYYLADNIEKATAGIPGQAFSILLSHTPEIYRKAAFCGIDLLLTGHTHGGQLCLPGGIPVVRNTRCPRRMTAGPWQYRYLQGYTSVGAGSSCLPVRFNCRPEITVHHLHRGEAPAGHSETTSP